MRSGNDENIQKKPELFMTSVNVRVHDVLPGKKLNFSV